jgi:DNA-directed RNA polymerase subunit RPC12/RpoP
VSTGPDRRLSRLIAFPCRVCDTRLHALPENVGRKVKCPDCGAGTVVPPPPKERPARPPAAMEGVQYDTWPVNHQPSASELRAAQPKLVVLECSLCGTRLSAELDQVNELIECPDCGAKTRVPAYVETSERPPWREDDGEELDLEIVSLETMSTGARAGAAELAAAQSAAAVPDAASETTVYSTRPKLVRWPLQTSILLFPLSPGLPVRLVLFAGWAAFVVWLALFGIGFITVPYGAFVTMFLLAVSVLIGFMCLAALAACWLTIITESSEGNDKIEAWPDILFLDWMFDGFYVVMAALVACLPGWALSHLWPDDSPVRAAMTLGGASLLFPIVLLSMLDIGSPFAPLSTKILASLFRAPISWLAFYIESIVLLAAIGMVGVLLLEWSILGLIVAAPLAVLGSIWYFRLLGRLGWVLAEKASE